MKKTVIFALCTVLFLSFMLSCNGKSSSPSGTTDTEPTTAETPLPPPADDRILMILESSGCGYPHGKVFRNPISHTVIDFSEHTELPEGIDAELLNELVILKLNDLYMKLYPNNKITSAEIKEAYSWTYEDVQYAVIYNIRFKLDDGSLKSSENLILLVPISMVTSN